MEQRLYDMDRIVHFDFKGAPLNISYLERVILSAKAWGATGFLLEWEDTFPFSGELAFIGSLGGGGGDGMYTLLAVQHILKFIKDCGLKAIQLLQTIGHMEYVLKHPSLAGLRERSLSPAVLCPSKPEGQQVVRLMLEQVLAVQPDAEMIHIGADEVWHTGVCEECARRAAVGPHGTAGLFLRHVQGLAAFLRERRPALTVLMWDDMLRTVRPEAIFEHRLGDLVQPVVWDYSGKLHISSQLWDNYRRVFPRVWAGSAFKGANGSCAILAPEQHYVSNQMAWIAEMKALSRTIHFSGVILTGWSRYDHYATLCELMPVAVPSLFSCLKTLTHSINAKAPSNAYPADVRLERLLAQREELWPGQEVAELITTVAELRASCYAYLHGDVVTTWLNQWQMEHKYTSPLQLERIIEWTQQYEHRLSEAHGQLQALMPIVTGPRSCSEWLRVYVAAPLADIVELRQKADSRYRTGASVRPE